MTGPYTQLTAGQITAKLLGIRGAQHIGDAVERRATWERCWSVNSTAPYFNRGNTHEHDQFVALRTRLFEKYFFGISEVVEFGCGAGDNLLATGDRRRRGYDWSESAVALCRRRGIEAEMFDMFNPHPVKLEGCAVFTVHALEQLGETWGRFVYLLRTARPRIVLHIEPILELYDPMDLDDFLAIHYHHARGYLRGLLPALRDWSAFVEILEVTKSPFGNINHKGYSVVAWRPK